MKARPPVTPSPSNTFSFPRVDVIVSPAEEEVSEPIKPVTVHLVFHKHPPDTLQILNTQTGQAFGLCDEYQFSAGPDGSFILVLDKVYLLLLTLRNGRAACEEVAMPTVWEKLELPPMECKCLTPEVVARAPEVVRLWLESSVEVKVLMAKSWLAYEEDDILWLSNYVDSLNNDQLSQLEVLHTSMCLEVEELFFNDLQTLQLLRERNELTETRFREFFRDWGLAKGMLGEFRDWSSELADTTIEGILEAGRNFASRVPYEMEEEVWVVYWE